MTSAFLGERRSCTRCGQFAFPHQERCAFCGGPLDVYVAPPEPLPSADPDDRVDAAGRTGGAGHAGTSGGSHGSGSSASGGPTGSAASGGTRRLPPAALAAAMVAFVVIAGAVLMVVTDRGDRTNVGTNAPPLGALATTTATAPTAGTGTTAPSSTTTSPRSTSTAGGSSTFLAGNPVLFGDGVAALTGKGATLLGPDGAPRWTVELCANPKWADESQQQVPAHGSEPLVVRCDLLVLGLDPATGATRWRANLTDDPEASRTNGEVLAVRYEDGVQVFDLADGRSRWSAELQGHDVAERIELDAQAAYTFDGGRLVRRSLLDGAVSWSAPADAGWLQVNPSTVFFPEVISGATTGRSKGTLPPDTVLGLAAVDSASGARRWASAKGDARLGNAVGVGASGDALMAVSGAELIALDGATGRERWKVERSRLRPEQAFVTDGLTVLHDLPGLRILDAADGRQVLDLPTRQGTPAIADGRLALVAGNREVVVQPLP